MPISCSIDLLVQQVLKRTLFQIPTRMTDSIQNDHSFIDPFRALLRASYLQWEVIK